MGEVLLAPCGSTACGAAAPNLLWALDAQGRLASGASNGSLCLTLASGDGPGVNLWPCAGAQSNALWVSAPAPSPPAPAGFVTLATRDAAAGFGCLDGGVGPGGVAVLNASAPGRKVYGIGGLAAIGGARLIYEYAEPVRSQILDLLFSPTGGTAMQILKTEIEGDMDSSYGSGPSFQHSRGEATSFRRGIYLPFLLGEAKKRNPDIGTYSLAWGTPGWVGNGSYLSQVSERCERERAARVRDALTPRPPFPALPGEPRLPHGLPRGRSRNVQLHVRPDGRSQRARLLARVGDRAARGARRRGLRRHAHLRERRHEQRLQRLPGLQRLVHHDGRCE
jgi:hypothetical protein